MTRAAEAAGALAVAVAAALASAAPARAGGDDALATASVVFARDGAGGTALYRSDARGKGEALLVQLPERVAVRALRTDADGKVLLADLGGKWWWMPLDGTQRALAPLPCGDGPAQLAVDGACVLCRSAKVPERSIVVTFETGKVTQLPVPAAGARLVGRGKDRKLVWADAGGVWRSPPLQTKQAARVAPEPPLRGFLPSPDGTRAVGVYADVVHEGKKTRPADMLMGFALDGQGARRKQIRDSVPVEWSHDGRWLLVQDGASACIVQASGGQYKCWKGYTAASIAPDGSFALLLGHRATDAPAKKPAKKPDKKPAPKKPKAPDPEPSSEAEHDGDDAPGDDVAVPPPGGPLALYRGKVEGAFTEPPTLLVRVVDGAAVWLGDGFK